MCPSRQFRGMGLPLALALLLLLHSCSSQEDPQTPLVTPGSNINPQLLLLPQLAPLLPSAPPPGLTRPGQGSLGLHFQPGCTLPRVARKDFSGGCSGKC